MPDVDAWRATRTANIQPVDFQQGVDPDAVVDEKPKPRSVYVRKLQELAEAIEAGEAQMDVAYKIGEYRLPYTAKQTAVHLVTRGKDLPEGVEFISRRMADGGSELWAAICGESNEDIDVRGGVS